jgi:hypothetical protein
LEPHLQTQLSRFFASDEGRDLVAELFTDLITDLVTPSADGGEDLLELLVLKLTLRLAKDRPAFRRQLELQLGARPLPELPR